MAEEMIGEHAGDHCLAGFTAKRATTGWPVEMPPRMPPALFDRNTGP
jgi:hypothetical protein